MIGALSRKAFLKKLQNNEKYLSRIILAILDSRIRGTGLASSRFFQNTKFWQIVIHCELSIFRMFFHGYMFFHSYSRAYKQNTKPESNRQKVINTIECCKDFHLMTNFTFLSLSRSRTQ